MAPFKTKKLPKKVREIPGISEKVGEISTPKIPLIEKKISPKLIIGILLGCLSIFFVWQIGIRAFGGNEKNGSDTFVPKTIIDDYTVQKITGTTNILIAGIGGKGHDGSDLTDSIMLASLDDTNHIVTLLSIPRDLYVAYPNGRGAGKINSLYDIGKRDKVGIQYLSDKVSEITGQSIDHHMVIDFAGFKKIIDILGGISIDVPEDIVDREYPDENWGYTTFIVRKGPQIFNGETALRYARSRHSTSDFDRSNRQQLIIKSIKEKATDLGIITNIDKIGEVFDTIISNLDTDLSIAKMAEIALSFSKLESDDINIISLSDICLSLTKCAPGSYLYTPSRELFGGSSVIIPENAQVNKLSYYTDIRKFVDLTFRFPLLRESPRDIILISDPSMRKRTQEIGIGLAKLGFPISFEKSLTMATGSIEKSHVNIYWNADLSVGINPDSPSIQALKYIEEGLPYTYVERNEYIDTLGPKIEIVIGKDGADYFKTLRSSYYLPLPEKPSTSGEYLSGQVGTGKKINPPKISSPSGEKTLSGERKIVPGDWEEF